MQSRTESPRSSKNPRNPGPPPADLVRRIEDLKECFVEASDLSVPFEYFDTHVAYNYTLLDFSDPTPNAKLLSTLETICQQATPRFVLREHLVFEVAGTGFWHGMALGRREQMCFYYFDDISMGLIGLNDPFDPRGAMHYLRFSVVSARGPTMPGPTKRGQA